jgi:hypothetical protein
MPELCIDGWTITCSEFQPQRSKKTKKQVSEGATVVNKDPLHQQNTSGIPDTPIHGTQLQDDTLIRSASKACYHCQEEGHFMKHCPKKRTHRKRSDRLKLGLPLKEKVSGSIEDAPVRNSIQGDPNEVVCIVACKRDIVLCFARRGVDNR